MSRHKRNSFVRDALDLILYTAWIYACYIGYGILQEAIYVKPYGPNGEKFDNSLFLVWAQCIVNGLFAVIGVLITRPPKDTVPTRTYFSIGLTYGGAMLASNWALNFVDYPTQALGKSCKLIPVMIMRIFVNKKKYHWREYLNVLILTVGIVIFMDSKKKAAAEVATSWAGLGLLFLSLFLDGLTGPRQEQCKHDHNPTMLQMMIWINFYAVLPATVALIAFGQLGPAIDFCTSNPALMLDILYFSLLSAFGQVSILMCLFRFNSLILTTITTTRKFFTILASVVYYGHQLALAQWMGVALVFFSLGLDIHFKYTGGGKSKDRQRRRSRADSLSSAAALPLAGKKAD